MGAARREDMFVAGHSIMGLNVINAALERAGGLILLGSMMLPDVTDDFPTASTWYPQRSRLSCHLPKGHAGRSCLALLHVA